MILVIAPSLEGLRVEWREAAENLGATQSQYWWHVGLPVLLPSLAGAMVLLFGNAFSAYATPYALASGGITLVPILIGQVLSGDVVITNPRLGDSLAFGMIVHRRHHRPRLRAAATEGGQVAPVAALGATTKARRGPSAAQARPHAPRVVLDVVLAHHGGPLLPGAALLDPAVQPRDRPAQLRLQVVRADLRRPHVPHELPVLAAAGGRDRHHRSRPHGADGLLGAPASAAAAAGHGRRLDPAVRGAAGRAGGGSLGCLQRHALAAEQLADPGLHLRDPGPAVHLPLARRRHAGDQRARR